MSLFGDVVQTLESAGIRHALIGAAALAIRGVSRSTADIDLLTIDPKALDEGLWAEFAHRGAGLRLLEGDFDDPLAGSVRLTEGKEVVDVVVGRFNWQREIIEAAESMSVGALSLPVVQPAGLVLLKLHAGGPKDAWDIRSLLDAVDEPARVTSEVERALPLLPSDARRLWSRIQSER
jgi:predicted nucleotidyltransferase